MENTKENGVADPRKVAKVTTVIHINAAPDGWQSSPDYVYVGRGANGRRTRFGNRFYLGVDGTREQVIARYRAWATERCDTDPAFRDDVAGLYGKTLVCFCAPLACHADVLKELAERFHRSMQRLPR